SCSASVLGSNYTGSSMSLPLQAKVTDSNYNTIWSNTKDVQIDNYNSNNNSNTNTNPTQSDVKGTLTISSDADNGYTSGQNITFTANGTDDNGIERIEVYVNADLVKTCYGATTCSYTGGPYTYNSLTYGAKLTDILGNSIWNGYKTIYKK
ncbi:MAG: Ig-like domain-containing protein, partial [Patescibacteria group bacterium]